MRTKTWSYALGAFFGGVAGAFYASFKSGAFPADFYFNISVFLLCMVILGGMGSDLGRGARRDDPRLPERRGPRDDRVEGATQAGIDFDPTKYQFGIYGVIIVLMMLFRPDRPDPGAAPQAASSSEGSPTRRSTTSQHEARPHGSRAEQVE